MILLSTGDWLKCFPPGSDDHIINSCSAGNVYVLQIILVHIT